MCQGRRRGEGLTVQHGGPHVSVLLFPLLFLPTAEAACFLSLCCSCYQQEQLRFLLCHFCFDINSHS